MNRRVAPLTSLFVLLLALTPMPAMEVAADTDPCVPTSTSLNDVPELKFYKDKGFEGTSWTVSGLGGSDSMSIWSDEVSSLIVPDGYAARVFKNTTCSGESRDFVLKVSEMNSEWNNEISSWQLVEFDSSHCVTAYRDTQFEGPVFQVCPDGKLPNTPSMNDKVSSVRVPPGTKLKMCRNSDGTGICRTFFRSVSKMGSMNDEYSSFSVTAFDPTDFTMAILSDPQLDFCGSAQFSSDDPCGLWKYHDGEFILCKCQDGESFSGCRPYPYAGGPVNANQKHRQSLKALRSEVGEESWAGLIINGDLTHGGQELQRDKYKDAYEEGASFNIYPGLGNHDYDHTNSQDNDLKQQMIEFVERRAKSVPDMNIHISSDGKTGSWAYSWDIGDFHFVQLQNYPTFTADIDADDFVVISDGDDLKIKKSLDWLADDLRAATGRPIVLNMHQINSNDGFKPDSAGMADFKQVLEDTGANVLAIFVGHIHGYAGQMSYECSVSPTDTPVSVSSTQRELKLNEQSPPIPIFYSGSAQYNKYLQVRFTSPEDGGPHELAVQVMHSGGDCGPSDDCPGEATAIGTIETAAGTSLRTPVVSGEVSTVQARPTWLWDLPEGATGFRHHLIAPGEAFKMDVVWTEVDSTVQSWTAEADPIPELPMTFEVQATNGYVWSSIASFTTTIHENDSSGPLWQGVARKAATSPQGNIAAVACHDCYSDTEGIAAEADLIELDVEVDGGVWYVDGASVGESDRAALSDVLATRSLRDSDQPLFIEIITSAEERDLRTLIEALAGGSYFVNGRPVFFRSSDEQILDSAREVMDGGGFPLQEAYLRTSLIAPSSGSVADLQDVIDQALADGRDLVELDWNTRNLFGVIKYARTKGMAIGLGTIPEQDGEVFCAFFRNEVDQLTTAHPVGDCRKSVEADNSLVHLDVSTLSEGSPWATYQKTDMDEFHVPIGGSGQPDLVWAPRKEDLYRGFLDFNASKSEYLSLYDADAPSGGGYLLGVVMNFEELGVGLNSTRALVSKADGGGFALEIRDDASVDILRFGVRVANAYHYATVPMSQFNGTDSYWIIGAYDGSGAVRLWWNGSTTGVTDSSSLSGGVTNNNSPVTLCADPQGPDDTRWHSDQKIQVVTLQGWKNR